MQRVVKVDYRVAQKKDGVPTMDRKGFASNLGNCCGGFSVCLWFAQKTLRSLSEIVSICERVTDLMVMDCDISSKAMC